MTARRAPYWTIPALLLWLWLPSPWVLAAAAGLALARALAAPLLRRARIARADPPSPGSVRLGQDEHGAGVTLAPAALAAHGLIVGASGAGKSTTLLEILTQQIDRGQPVVAIDLKGSPAFARRLEAAAAGAGRPFRLWTPDGPARWNPLRHGNATELKDKLIATERFTEPHYQRAAERYVQTALSVLRVLGREPDLASVVALMEPRRLMQSVRGLGPERAGPLEDYLATLSPDQLSAVRGLGTRLAVLSESAAGAYLGPDHDAIDLSRALRGSAIVLFSLNSSRYGQLAAQLGTLAIQDLVAVTGHRLEGPGGGATATVAIDEFSALGSDQLLALLARGRESGVSVLLATQELSDLERAGRGFRDQVLGLTALKIVHRQDVPRSALTFAEMAGTERVWEESRTTRRGLGPLAGGVSHTHRPVDRFLVEPDEIKRLATGQAVLLAKAPTARLQRVRVRAAGAGRDQPAPGVTR